MEKKPVLIFGNGQGNIVKEALQERDFSGDAAVLAKAAQIVTRDLFSHEGFSFSGTFPVGCQESSVPCELEVFYFNDNEWTERNEARTFAVHI